MISRKPMCSDKRGEFFESIVCSAIRELRRAVTSRASRVGEEFYVMPAACDVGAAAEVELWRMLQELRREEGSSVTIHAENEDLDGPNSLIEVRGEWTGWRLRRFAGQAVKGCLQDAIGAYRRERRGA